MNRPRNLWVSVNTTSASLLDRLCHTTPADADWVRLDDLYRPLIRTWLARTPGLTSEIDDLTQEVFVVIVRELPRFRRQRDGSFRAWLRQVTVNQVRAWRRTRRPLPLDDLRVVDGYLSQLEDPASPLSQQWDREHDQHVFNRLLAAARPDFTPSTWEAFRLFALGEGTAAEVAEQTGLSVNAVIVAKSRVLKRLREEAAGLID